MLLFVCKRSPSSLVHSDSVPSSPAGLVPMGGGSTPKSQSVSEHSFLHKICNATFLLLKAQKTEVLRHKYVCTATAIQTTPGSTGKKTLVKVPKVQNLRQLGMEQPGLPALWPSLLTLLSGNRQPHTWPQNVSFRIHQCFWRKQGPATRHYARLSLSILAFPVLLSFFCNIAVSQKFPLYPCCHTCGWATRYHPTTPSCPFPKGTYLKDAAQHKQKTLKKSRARRRTGHTVRTSSSASELPQLATAVGARRETKQRHYSRRKLYPQTTFSSSSLGKKALGRPTLSCQLE